MPPTTPIPSQQKSPLTPQQRLIYNTIAAVNKGQGTGNSGSGGTVTSVGLSMPATFAVAGSPVTDSGTITVSYISESANTVFAGPTTGVSAAPTFRSIVTADFPASGVTAGTYVAATITVDATGRLTSASTASTTGSGTVTSVALSMPSILSVAGSPITSSGTITASLVSESANTVFAGPTSGASASPTFRALVSADIPSVAGTLIGYQTITATGSYTYSATAGTNFVIVELQGAGGGGAGAAQTTAGKTSLGGSGGGGGWLRVLLTSNFNGATGSVGTHGNGGSSGANNGTNGGDTTFVVVGGGTTYTAGGGQAGATNSGLTPPTSIGSGSGGECTNGDVQRPGSNGGVVQSLSTTNAGVVPGGQSMFGGGPNVNGTGTANTSVDGVAARGKGSGGGGAAVLGTGVSRAGANGADGMAIIWEYR
jgi:hypothetical protein